MDRTSAACCRHTHPQQNSGDTPAAAAPSDPAPSRKRRRPAANFPASGSKRSWHPNPCDGEIRDNCGKALRLLESEEVPARASVEGVSEVRWLLRAAAKFPT